MEELHVQLRRAREQRGLSIEALAQVAGVHRTLVASLEAGQFAALPAGLYGRHAVRACARAVGLDEHQAVTTAAPLLPAPEDPIAALARLRGGTTDVRPRPSPVRGDQVGAAAAEGAEPGDRAEAPEWRPMAAVVIDGLLLGAFALGLAAATAWAAGVPLPDVAPVAAPAWLLITLVTGASYFALLGGARHATLGARMLLTRDSARGRGIARGRPAAQRDRGELRDRLCF